jgi:hypothetical protein
MSSVPSQSVTLELTGDEALVLFEFLHRFEDTDKLSISDQSEERILWNLSARLEKVLVAPFASNYAQLLEEARERLRDAAA